MNVYVASSFKNIPEAREVMDGLQAAGHRIVHDWTRESVDPSWTPKVQDAYLQNCGGDDFKGVLRADAVVLVNHPEARDAMTEFGIALGAGKTVFVLYPERRTSVFFHRAILCKSFTELLRAMDSES